MKGYFDVIPTNTTNDERTRIDAEEFCKGFVGEIGEGPMAPETDPPTEEGGETAQ